MSTRKFPPEAALKRTTCVGTLLQNESNSDVVRFTTHESGRGVESCVNTKLDKITRKSLHTRELGHLLQNKFTLDR